MDHLQAIRLFVRVVETGSFTHAAQSLQVPAATASKWVRALETHLGVALLERTTRRVKVTAEGVAYYEHTRRLLSELDDVESTLGQARTRPRGMLRVDTGAAVATHILIPALPSFCTKYPDLKLRLSATDRMADLVVENIDCAIRVTADDPRLVSRPIAMLRWATCASPAWLAQHGVPTHPNDLVERRQPVAGYFSATSGRVRPLQFRRGSECVTLEDVHYSVQVSDSSSQLAIAVAGMGLIHTLEFMVRAAIRQGVLVPVLAEWRPDPVPVYVAYPPSRRYSTKVRVFVDWAAKVFASLESPSVKAVE